DGDHADEPEVPGVPAGEVQDEDAGRDHAAELDDEHHRVPDLEPRVELREGGGDRARHDVAGEDARRLARHHAFPSRARLSRSTLTPGSPKNPHERPVVYSAIRCWTVVSGRWRTAAIRRDCSWA